MLAIACLIWKLILPLALKKYAHGRSRLAQLHHKLRVLFILTLKKALFAQKLFHILISFNTKVNKAPKRPDVGDLKEKNILCKMGISCILDLMFNHNYYKDNITCRELI